MLIYFMTFLIAQNSYIISDVSFTSLFMLAPIFCNNVVEIC